MADVSFEEQDWQADRSEIERPPNAMIKWVLKTGIVKNPKQANYVLVGLAIVFFGLSIYFFVSASGGSSSKTNTPAVNPAANAWGLGVPVN